ncbi:MAG: RNA methyltransferase [Lentisphaerae bacterium]|nr:RNA methyltransferase [Lentisphaerota bacterium]
MTTECLYGINVADEILRAGRRRVRRAFLSARKTPHARMRALRRALEAARVDCEETDDGRLARLCGSRDHQGIVLAADPYPYAHLDEVFAAERILLPDNIEDPHNLGAILRTAEFLGYSGVCLPTRGTPEVYASVMRVSAGAAEHLRIARCRTANHYARLARERGFSLIALDAQGRATLAALASDPPARFMLVIGGEDKAVGQFILNMADHTVRIGGPGRVGSLNASVAAALAMYALRPEAAKTAAAARA